MDPPEEATTISAKSKLTQLLHRIREVITVEPVIASYLIAVTLASPAIQQLQYEKACRANLGLNKTVCDQIAGDGSYLYPNETERVQLAIGNLNSWNLPISSVIPLVLVLFLGAYSDRHQWRKPFLIMPLLGELIALPLGILSVIYMDSWTIETHAVVQVLLPNFFGGQTMLIMALFAYVADNSTLEMRTLRLGIVQIVINVCSITTSFVSSRVFNAVGYLGIFVIAGVWFLIGIVYALMCIKENRKSEGDVKKNVCADIFDTTQVVDTVNVIFKKKPGNKRLQFLLISLGLFVMSMVNIGEGSLWFLYTKEFLGWDLVDLTNFSTFNTLIHLAGTTVAIPLFTKVLKLHDLTILLLAFLNKILSNIIMGFARTTAIMYVASVVSLIIGVTTISLRSLTTKVVIPEDVGKAQSLFAIVETLGAMVAGPFYNKGIYVNTYASAPSFFLFVCPILYGAYILVIIWMYFKDRREQTAEPSGESPAEKPTDLQTETGNMGIANEAFQGDKSIPLQEIHSTHM
ncbi:solute carrier family 46 member 3-like [Anthonomus grandis grandis]|uniref:solute carrier family 46 member 3-like n=1 Tax=Anthonomus grandis grandis TaxID=2921223 RepID=UPI002165E6AD|nr:solute carrier family 46 member 3-like [Anthonomus grandis grandis]